MPGQRLVEADLSAAVGASRSTVREALGRLGAEGTVLLERHRGASIRRLTRADVVALYDVREVVEGLAARLATDNGRGRGFAEIERAYGALSRHARNGDISAYARANTEFHDAIISAAKHPLVAELVARLRLPILRIQFRSLLSLETIAKSQDEHTKIFKAIKQAEPAKAETRMRSHVRRSAQAIAGLPDSIFG